MFQSRFISVLSDYTESAQQQSYGEWRYLVRAETIVNNDNNDINVSLTSFVSGENVILIS